ncbi:MAG: hypothetical protein DRJ41_04640 [Thermoprotei archaeon]|nr:MAG: hypothetical protein DRJ41_04640 [Thermoprotei archaeon]
MCICIKGLIKAFIIVSLRIAIFCLRLLENITAFIRSIFERLLSFNDSLIEDGDEETRPYA